MSTGDPAWFSRPAARTWDTPAAGGGARIFHAALPGYRPTPLVELPSLATDQGRGLTFGPSGVHRKADPELVVAARTTLAREPFDNP